MTEFQKRIEEAFQQAQTRASAKARELEAEVRKVLETLGDRAQAVLKVLLDREVPSGGLPSDVGVGVFNVATLAQIGDLLPRRQGLIERVVTIAGPGVTKPGNYLIALGTPLRWALEQAGCTSDAASVVLGGPMMGPAISSCLSFYWPGSGSLWPGARRFRTRRPGARSRCCVWCRAIAASSWPEWRQRRAHGSQPCAA